tara:strand:- start:332 stop:556 length:225 start_codon:yes stop_codon:yes gene_type:complete
MNTLFYLFVIVTFSAWLSWPYFISTDYLQLKGWKAWGASIAIQLFVWFALDFVLAFYGTNLRFPLKYLVDYQSW